MYISFIIYKYSANHFIYYIKDSIIQEKSFENGKSIQRGMFSIRAWTRNRTSSKKRQLIVSGLFSRHRDKMDSFRC